MIGYSTNQISSTACSANQIQKDNIKKCNKSQENTNFTEIKTHEEQSFDDYIKKYQVVISDFLMLHHQLYKKKKNEISLPILENIDILSSINGLKKRLLQIKKQVTDCGLELQKEQNQINHINQSLIILPEEQKKEQEELDNIKQQISSLISNIPINQTKLTELKIQQTNKKLKIAELELSKLNFNNQQEILKLRISLLKKRHNQLNEELQKFISQLIELHHEKTKTIEKNRILYNCKNEQLLNSYKLSNDLNQQINNMHYIKSKQQQTNSYITQSKKILNNLLEQSQWLDKSSTLGNSLRAQLSKLPKIPKYQQLDNNMVRWQTKRLKYENQLNELHLEELQNKNDGNTKLTIEENNTLITQLNIKKDLLNLLITGCDTQILELTKLKIAYEQLKKIIKEVQKTAHRALFWTADIRPITSSYPLQVYKDLQQILNYNALKEFKNILKEIFLNKKSIILLNGSIILIGLQIYLQRHYNDYLTIVSNKIGKISKDNFLFTIHIIFWSIIISLPIPLLWIAITYNFKYAWTHPLAVTIGDAMSNMTPALWIFIIILYFAKDKGLFITHFRWSKLQIKKALRHHISFFSIITLSIISSTTFEKYNDHQFYNTLGRSFFILSCIYITLITLNLKKSKLPLYINKNGTKDNVINKLLWNIMLCAPIMASLFSCWGYLMTSKILLTQLEKSIGIWILLLIIYDIIKRWMFIQHRRIISEKNKKKENIIYTAPHNPQKNLPKHTIKINKQYGKTDYNLHVISAKSLQLIRSIFSIIAVLSIIILWSELHSTFSFLENITLWNVTSNISTKEDPHRITLGAALISILVFVITIKLVRNLPSLLELILLQRINLTPGTGYAITTLTKYGLMLFGGLIGFSFIGIEWSKLQWLIAALGVGLGFGLQEIFANFISGLMILFEKPIRIGDTVTIQNFTGNITRINTRTTTITDLDNKEIIVPNKEFITKQFTNWSLTNTITRVVLKIPVPLNINTEKITSILLETVKNCPLVLDVPSPEAYLTDLQQGLPIFEIRLYTEKMSYRMPLRHQIHTLILNAYKTHGLELPCPPFQIRKDLNITIEKFS
ncbi:miniconductance mechanosensitive channel MscM [Blochmannia endosymbiont of Colobopsis nipponica]|nr:miniconductance mechanosensitive channel MscM [Blochmannia endosymbiont of Colobopsis nipponica]